MDTDDQLVRLPDVCRMLGEADRQRLKKACQRGQIPGAVKILEGRKRVWAIPAAEVERIHR